MTVLFHQLAISQNFEIDKITIENGLDNNTVISVFIDKKGNAWFTSSNGLTQYNGAEFYHYNMLSKPKLKITDISTLNEDKLGNIWIASGRTIQVLNPNNKSILLSTTVSSDISQFLIIDSTEVWVLGNQIDRFKNYQYVNVVEKKGKSSHYSFGVVTKDFVLFQNIDEGFVINNKNHGGFITVNRFRASMCSYGDKIYFIQNNNLYEFKNGQLEFVHRLDFLVNQTISVEVLQDKQGRLWFISDQRFLYVYEPTANTYFTIKAEFNNEKIFDCDVDNFGNVWVCGTGGITIFKPNLQKIKKLKINSNQKIGNYGCRKIIQYKKGYLAIRENSLLIYEPTEKSLEYKEEKLIGGDLGFQQLRVSNRNGFEFNLDGSYSFFESMDIAEVDNEIWVCGLGLQKVDLNRKKGFLYSYQNNGGTIIPIKDNLCISYFEHKFYIGNVHNLYIFEKSTNQYSKFTDAFGNCSFESQQIWDLCKVGNELYVGSWSGLYKIRNNKVEKINAEFLDLPINDLHYDNNGYLWIGTNGYGLVQYNLRNKTSKLYSRHHGLSCNTVSNVFQDKEKNIWISSFYGLNYFDQKNQTFINYYKKDGLSTDELNRKSYLVQDDGQIIVGGLNEFNIFDPKELLQNNEAVRILLLRAEVNSRKDKIAMIDLERIKFSSEGEQLNLVFALNNFFDKSGHKYYYRIVGLIEDWQFLGNKQTLTLMNLPPGDYIVEIKGAQKNGQFSENALKLPISVSAVFYKTAWFIILSSLMVVFIIYYFFQLRMRQVKKMSVLRTKLASDLHDEVGGNLVQIAMLTENLRYSEENEQEEVQNKIADISRNAVRTMRDVIWSVDSRNDTLENVLLKMKEYAHEILSHTGKNYDFQFIGIDTAQKLSVELRQNIYLLFKEGINNIAKHSNCKNVHISINQKKGKLIMEIHDDGTWIEPMEPKTGQGLENMKMRAKFLKGELEINKTDGFTVKLTIPWS